MHPESPAAHWPQRLLPIAAVAGLWAATHYVVDGLFRRPPTTPLVLAAAPLPLVVAGLIVAVGIRSLARVGIARRPGTALAVAGAALALWASRTGNIDDWLLSQHPQPTGHHASAYAVLLADYVLFALMGVAILGKTALPARRDPAVLIDRSRPHSAPWPAVLLATVVAIALLLILTGPIASRTLRGQVYFAAFISVGLGVVAARRTFHTRDAAAYWLVPIVAGVVGAAVAAVKPDLMIPSGYNHLNALPAWGPVRALPIELVSIGWLALSWAASGSTDATTSRAH